MRIPTSLVLTITSLTPFLSLQAGLIGNDLIDRPARDGANGGVFLISTDTDGGVLDTFSFFDNAAPGRIITPLILRAAGTGYEISGIGTSRTSTGAGTQTAPFDLVSGSAQFGLGYALAWKDGGSATSNPGVAEFTNDSNGRAYYFGTHSAVAVNDSYTAPQRFGRTYSIRGNVSGSGNDIVGSTLVNRNSNDTATGAIFVLDDAFAAPGQVNRWSIFDDDGSGRQITPLLLQLNGVNWEILGQGTTRTSDGSGAQLFDFGLVAGSDAVDPSIRFGFKDGGNGSNNAGVADWSGIPGGQQVFYLGAGRTTTNIGESFPVSGTFERTYSIEALALTVPEPNSVALVLLGGLGLRLVRRKKRV